jgi:SET domain-containing protein
MILLKDDTWEVRNTKRKGRGIFTKKRIMKGTVIGDYLGKVIHPRDAVVDEENLYLMYYHDKAAIVPDLNKSGIHLLNHSCVPNAFLYTHMGHTLAFALRQIEKNEELTIPYLLSPQDEFCNPCLHICECGNLQCTGTMHLSKNTFEKWRVFNNKWAKKTKRKRISYEKELAMLDIYPKAIPTDYIDGVNRLFKNIE